MCVMQVSALMDDILGRASARGLSKLRLAEKAGIRPETLSRLQHKENADFKTLANLAMAVGLQLTLSPLDESPDVAVFSPSANASDKKQARRQSERLLSAGLVAKKAVHRRSGFFAFPKAKFEIKNLKGKQGNGSNKP
jgi:transcriptional regulator with XRE-family HTH domain